MAVIDTPILDAAIRATCERDEQCRSCPGRCARAAEGPYRDAAVFLLRAAVPRAYRAIPIVRELWPEEGR